jgi:hypothetical protein
MHYRMESDVSFVESAADYSKQYKVNGDMSMILAMCLHLLQTTRSLILKYSRIEKVIFPTFHVLLIFFIDINVL